MIRLYRAMHAPADDHGMATLTVPGEEPSVLETLAYDTITDGTEGELGTGHLPQTIRDRLVAVGEFTDLNAARAIIAEASRAAEIDPPADLLAQAGFSRNGGAFTLSDRAGRVVIEHSLRGTRVHCWPRDGQAHRCLMTLQVRDPKTGARLWPGYLMSERHQIAAAIRVAQTL